MDGSFHKLMLACGFILSNTNKSDSDMKWPQLARSIPSEAGWWMIRKAVLKPPAVQTLRECDGSRTARSVWTPKAFASELRRVHRRFSTPIRVTPYNPNALP